MDLHVVHVLKRDAVARGDVACVAGKAREVGGTRVRAADAAAGPKRLTCEDTQLRPVGRMRKDAAAARLRLAVLAVILRDQDVVHAGVLQDADVGQLAHASKQRGGDLVAGDVAVEADARTAVRALAGVAKVARLVALEVHAAFHQVRDDAAACADHQIHAFAAVLVVARAQGVLEKRRVVGVVVLHADAALRQHGIAFAHGRLRQHHHGKR